METRLPGVPAKFYPLLETFLVEWKQRSVNDSFGKEQALETFLVEWKLFRNIQSTTPGHTLETFLVEWKLSFPTRKCPAGPALKPS